MRVRRFNLEYPNGKLFTDPEELRKAEETGEWTDGAHKIHNKELYIAKFAPKEKQEPQIEKLCECGCGTPVKRRFVRGHFIPKGVKNGNREDSEPPDQSGTL